MATLAEELINSLKAQGVKYVFGIPGGHGRQNLRFVSMTMYLMVGLE